MLVCKDNLGFGVCSWCYVVIVNDGVIEVWFEELGCCDDCGDDFYSEILLENVMVWLKVKVNVVV